VTSSGTTISRPRATIHLDAVVANYRTICRQAAGVQVAAVVKADGYGLGAVPVSEALWAAGCRRFFVARVEEGLALRQALADAEIAVFDGALAGTGQELIDGELTPILNSLGQIEHWCSLSAEHDVSLAAGLHIDTGMRRLGLDNRELDILLRDVTVLEGLDVRHVMSHLACADVPGNHQSAEQLAAFSVVRARLPMGTASLANSAGTFLGPEYHFELVRPGISLYGGTPFPDSGRPNPMRSVVTVEAPIIQIRQATADETVGYGATYTIGSDARLATVPVGYADGFLRSSSNRGEVAVAGTIAPIVGRVSMDLITIDVTAVDQRLVYPGAPVELIGPNCLIDDVASRARSIPHEFLTRLSKRFEIRYLPSERSAAFEE